MNNTHEEIKIPQIDEVQIKIPDVGGAVTAEDVTKEADSKFKDINYILLSTIIILMVMVATLVIDSFHINSATYKEYSQKTDAVESIQKSNEILMKQVIELTEQNKNNQQVFLDQQKKMIEKLK